MGCTLKPQLLDVIGMDGFSVILEGSINNPAEVCCMSVLRTTSGKCSVIASYGPTHVVSLKPTFTSVPRISSD